MARKKGSRTPLKEWMKPVYFFTGLALVYLGNWLFLSGHH